MPIENADYFIKVVPFPLPVPAFVHLNSDSTYTIFLNSNMDYDHMLDGFEHEIWHIINDDLYGDKDIKDIEPQLGTAS